MRSEFIGPWTRRRVIDEFSGFPKCIAHVIAEYCATPQLLSWIHQSRINMEALCANPMAIESGMIDVRYANHSNLVHNPAAAEYIKTHWNTFSGYRACWGNPGLFDWMIANYPDDNNKWLYIGKNSNPNAVKYILEKQSIYRINLSNPSITLCGSWDKILANIPSHMMDSLYANPSAIDKLCFDYLDDTMCEYLSENPHPRAIEYFRTHQDKIDWWCISKNPGIFEYRTDPRLVDALSE